MSRFMNSAQERHSPEWVLQSCVHQTQQMLQLQYSVVPQPTMKSNNSQN